MKKILLYYCSLLAVFITISGILINSNLKNISTQLVFLPVPLYFLYTLVSQFRQPKKLVIGGLFLAILLAIGLVNVSKSVVKVPPSPPPPAVQKAVEPEATQETPKLIIKIDDPKSWVNIRQEASTSAKIIGKAKHNQIYQSLSKENDWYQIEFKNTNTGWIHQDFVEILEESKL